MDLKKLVAMFMVFLIVAFPICSATELVSYYESFSVDGGVTQMSSDENSYVFSSSNPTTKGIFTVKFDDYATGNTFKVSGISPQQATCDDAKKQCVLTVPMSVYTASFTPKFEMFASGGTTSYFYGPQFSMKNNGPVIVTSSPPQKVGPGRNVTFTFTTYDDFISYLQINDKFLFVNKSISSCPSGICEYSIQITPQYYQDGGNLQISPFDRVGNKGMSVLLNVFVDNEAPVRLPINVPANPDAIDGFVLLKDGKYYDISVPDQLKPENAMPGMTLLACFSDASGAPVAKGDFSGLSTASQSNLQGNCVRDASICQDDDSYKCSFTLQMLKSSICNQNDCGKSFTVNISDAYGLSNINTYSFNSKFFNDQPSDVGQLKFYIRGTPHSENSEFYFYQGNQQTMEMVFSEPISQGQTISEVFVPKSNIENAMVDPSSSSDSSWMFTKIDDTHFVLENFTFKKTCGNFCDIAITYKNNLGVTAIKSVDGAKHLDFDFPIVTDVKYDLSNTSDVNKFKIFEPITYFSDNSIASVKFGIKDNQSGVDNTTISLIFPDKTLNAKCQDNAGGGIAYDGSCMFFDITPNEFAGLLSATIKISDLAGNERTYAVRDVLSGVQIIKDVTAPYNVKIGVTHYPKAMSAYPTIIVTGDDLLFEINASDVDSKNIKAFINTSGLCLGDTYIAMNCINTTSTDYNCVSPLRCTIAPTAYGTHNYKYFVYDKAGNNYSSSFPVEVTELSGETVDCLRAEPNNQNDQVELPQYLLYNGPPMLSHDFKLALSDSATCAVPRADPSKVSIIASSVDCSDINIGDLSDTDGASIYGIITKYSTADSAFKFKLQLNVLSTQERGANIFNTTSFPIQCNASFSVLYNNRIYSQENVLLKVNYTYVDSVSAQFDPMIQEDFDTINSIKKNYASRTDNWFWPAVTDLEKLIEYSESWCNLGKTVEQVNSVVGSLGGILDATGTYVKGPYGEALKYIGQALEWVHGLIGGYLTGQVENDNLKDRAKIGDYDLLVNKDGRARWGWEGSSIGGLSCRISTCGGDSYLDVSKLISSASGSKNDNWCGYVKQVLEGAWIDGQAGVSDQTKSDAKTYASEISVSSFGRSNLIGSVFCGCIPGIVYQLNKYRQMECKLGYCLQNMTVSVAPADCYGQYELDVCEFWAGDIINELLSATSLDKLFNNLWDMFDSPGASILAGIKSGLTCFDQNNKLKDSNKCQTEAKNKILPGGTNLYGTITNLLSTNYETVGTSFVLCETFCATNNDNSKVMAALAGTLVTALEVWEYTIYLKNNDMTKSEFWWKDGETNKVDWCSYLMGDESSHLMGGAS